MNRIVEWLFAQPGQLFLAGLAGGLVRWITLKEPWRELLASLVVGSLCALYLGPHLGPAIEPFLGAIVTDSASKSGLVGFLIGIGGITLAGLGIDFWKGRRRMLKKAAEEDSK